MGSKRSILILGASYGSLLGTKLVLAGHDVTLICLPEEAKHINDEGAHVRIPVRGRGGLVEVDTRDAPGTLAAAAPADVSPGDFDLVGLAMQEPQYRSDGVRQLLGAVATSRVPCMSIMNMPPLPYLARLPGLDTDALRECYADASVWDAFDPRTITLASPDPQAFRPPDEAPNVLQVSLPTNFKVARFEDDEPTRMLREIEADIQAVRFDTGDESVELPVKLRVHDSVYVPLAKWSMLLTGNYRCVQEDGPRSIRDAVHSDPERSREIYEWVGALCRDLGAAAADQVPFEKYAKAAEGLSKPSSAARALFAGAPFIERVDRLVRDIAASRGRHHPTLDDTVRLVDERLARNRA